MKNNVSNYLIINSAFTICILFLSCTYKSNKQVIEPAVNQPIDTVSVYFRIPNLIKIDSLEALFKIDQAISDLKNLLNEDNEKDRQYLSYRISILEKQTMEVFSLTEDCETNFWLLYFKYKSAKADNKIQIADSLFRKSLRQISNCWNSYNIPQKNILLELSDFAQYEIEEYALADSLYHLTEDFINKCKITDTAYILKVYSGHANIKRHLSEYEFAQHYVFKAFNIMKDPLGNPW